MGPRQMPSNNLYESDAAMDKDDREYAPASHSSLLPRKRPMHGKLTAAILGGSVCLNAMLVLYCVNMQFMKPLAYDRGQELAYLQMKDRELSAQKASLERTTQGLMQQKEQLLQHYKETESVGKKLETYKEKLRVDAQVAFRGSGVAPRVDSVASQHYLPSTLTVGFARGGVCVCARARWCPSRRLRRKSKTQRQQPKCLCSGSRQRKARPSQRSNGWQMRRQDWRRQSKNSPTSRLKRRN
jgi:hypothetical protein